MTTPLVSDKSFHGGVTEMAPPLNSVGVIYSPRYKGENGQIPESADCSLIMKLPVAGKVTLSIKDFDLPRTHNCKTSSLSIYQTKDDVDVGGGKYWAHSHAPLWARITKNTDWTMDHCTRALVHLYRSLAHFAYSLTRGKVDD